ncbi:hypothetical protein SLG_11480 [Sphingobium sp. SYK-6]|uniref:winged helix-turn-helix domain-containing protein n=1 Tax=Sphingobium sp. (strain NBRC 103272 / SYK-6) TaxID=627192 RepID=UPI00022770F3|nr:winged helix-turn-helix domain-containing protein [Sphingobium sp. SYK-6]BAK65823.1 hypothetical protein SLG_11480 [Sphingobium sp. SYK-6]
MSEETPLEEELRYHQLAELLRCAAEAVTTARCLLEQTRYAISPFALDAFAATAPLESFSTFLKRQQEAAGAAPPAGLPPAIPPRPSGAWQDVLWHGHVPERICECLPPVGLACARVLLRLMEEPGRSVPVRELGAAAGTRSSSTSVVKVYVCRLRSALARQGISPAVIETVSRSYRLRPDGLVSLSQLLAARRPAA